jgi:hypothetical protein
VADIFSLLSVQARSRRNALASLRVMRARRAHLAEAAEAVAAAAAPADVPAHDLSGSAGVAEGTGLADQLPSRRKGAAASSW